MTTYIRWFYPHVHHHPAPRTYLRHARKLSSERISKTMSTAAAETMSTGLAQTSGNNCKRKAAQTLPARMGKIWATVTVIGHKYETKSGLVWVWCISGC